MAKYPPMRKGVEMKPGSVYGRLTVIDMYDLIYGDGYRYLCKCSCGNTAIVKGKSLRNGDTRSCGCLNSDTSREAIAKAHAKNHRDNTYINKLKMTGLQKNNSSGTTGVYWHKHMQKWFALVIFQNKRHHLGYFKDKEEAIAARNKAEREIHDEYLKSIGLESKIKS